MLARYNRTNVRPGEAMHPTVPMNNRAITRVREVARRDVDQGQGRRPRKVAQFFDADEHRCALCGFNFPRLHSREERRRHETGHQHAVNHAYYLRVHDEFAMEAHDHRQREIAHAKRERKCFAVGETIEEHGADAWVTHFDDHFKAALFDAMRCAHAPGARAEAYDSFLQLKLRVRTSLLERAALVVFGEDVVDRSFLLSRLVAPHCAPPRH